MAYQGPTTLKVLQHNVRHWKSLYRSLSMYYTEEDPAVILINSHGNKKEEEIKIHGYQIYHQKNQDNRRDDGVAIAVKKSIKAKSVDHLSDSTAAVKIETSRGYILIATMYLPPRRPSLPTRDLAVLNSHNIPCYLIGDFNAKHRSMDDTTNNQVGLEIAQEINTGRWNHQGPNFYTWANHIGAGRPDRVLTNSRCHHNILIRRGEDTTSDHVPVITTISASPIQVPIPLRANYNKADWQVFQAILSTHQVQRLGRASKEVIDEAITTWMEKVETAADRAIPKTRYKTLPHPPTPQYIKNLQEQAKDIIQFGTTIGWNRWARDELHSIRQRLKEEYQELSTTRWNELVEEAAADVGNPKEFWKKIKNMMGSQQTKVEYITAANGTKKHDDQGKEEALQEKWREVFRISPEENQNFDAENENRVLQWLRNNEDRRTPYPTADPGRHQEEDITREITTEEIQKVIQEFKQKAPGISNITKLTLQHLPENMTEQLKEIFNASLTMGYFPDKFKLSKMIFIPKAGKNHSQPENYRPISLLEVPGKVFEKTINARLKKFLEEEEKYNVRQYGFRKKRSTLQAIALATELISQWKTEGRLIDIVQRDVSKAFDKVWHDGLQFKILQLGLPNSMEKLLCNFLVNRKARITVGIHTGPMWDLASGVPQGSCLSPTLYACYTADMPEPGHHAENIIFADDVTQIVSYQGQSTNLMARKTMTEARKINDFEKKWKIKTNNQKFKIVPIGRYKTSPIEMDGVQYEYQNSCTILGYNLTRHGKKDHALS